MKKLFLIFIISFVNLSLLSNSSIINSILLLGSNKIVLFINSDIVLLCPIFGAGEKKNLNFNKIEFAKLITRLSKTQVIIIKNFKEISNYFKKNFFFFR